MAEVEIKFMQMFKAPMLDGRKTCTSRNKPVAEAGDTFEVFGAKFKVTRVMPLLLKDVADLYWRDEGATSSEHFLRIWKRTQRNREPDLERTVYMHRFRREETTA